MKILRFPPRCECVYVYDFGSEVLIVPTGPGAQRTVMKVWRSDPRRGAWVTERERIAFGALSLPGGSEYSRMILGLIASQKEFPVESYSVPSAI